MMSPYSGIARKRALSPVDVVWMLLVILLLVAILLPSLARAREIAKREVA